MECSPTLGGKKARNELLLRPLGGGRLVKSRSGLINTKRSFTHLTASWSSRANEGNRMRCSFVSEADGKSTETLKTELLNASRSVLCCVFGMSRLAQIFLDSSVFPGIGLRKSVGGKWYRSFQTCCLYMLGHVCVNVLSTAALTAQVFWNDLEY